jgi:hypothetical protein
MTTGDTNVHDRAVNAMTRVPTPIATPLRLCGGRIHAERGETVALDLTTRAGRSRVGLAEDGAVFCRSCAIEVARGGDDPA